jgi:hypothetical protein
MAIATVNAAIAGLRTPVQFVKGVGGTMVAGRPHSFWGIGGMPAAGAFDATLNGVTLAAPIAGQLPFTNPTSGNSYLARLQATLPVPGTLLLCDRLWHNGGFTITQITPHAITSPTWPARDADGATAGKGVMLGLEISAAVGAGTPTITIGYTNSAGTDTRTGTEIDTTIASSIAGTFYRIGLQAGDLGVRSVQSLTLSATWTSGTMNLVAYRVLAALEIPFANVPNAIDALTAGFPRMYDGSVPFLIWIPSATTTIPMIGSMTVAQG